MEEPSLHIPPELLKQIALASADPSSWIRLNTLAHSTLSDNEDFELEWFLRWQPILLPHRTWQYAVLTWRRYQGAAPRRTAQFMLRVLEAKQQQYQQQPQQQQPVVLDPESVAATRKYVGWKEVDGQFHGTFPNLIPLPSTLRKVRKLLNQQQPAAHVRALVLLCPCPSLLLCQYAARDQTPASAAAGYRPDGSSSSDPMPLLQHLMQALRPLALSATLHIGSVRTSTTDKVIQGHRLGCLASIAAGKVPQLLLDLPKSCAPLEQKPVLLKLMLPYAVRYSTAACVHAVVMRFDTCDRREVLGPQHVELAAGRIDSWAPGVVQLLMRLLSPKQLKPTHMRAAYTAACATGCLPVLSLLLAHAAATPKQHLLVLLKALADSGSLAVAELLLGDAQAALHQLLQQQQDPAAAEAAAGGQLCQVASTAALLRDVQVLRAAFDDLTEDEAREVLAYTLPQQHCSIVQAVVADPDAARLRLTDLVWQALPTQLQYIITINSFLDGSDGFEEPATGTYLWQPSSLLWRQQYGVRLEVENRRSSYAPYSPTTSAVEVMRWASITALEAGTQVYARKALQLHHAANRFRWKYRAWQLPQHSDINTAWPGISTEERARQQQRLDAQQREAAAKASCGELKLARAMLQGRLAGACAACDEEAVHLLERVNTLCVLLLHLPANYSSSSSAAAAASGETASGAASAEAAANALLAEAAAGALSAEAEVAAGTAAAEAAVTGTTATANPMLSVLLLGGVSTERVAARLCQGLGLPVSVLGTLWAAAGLGQLDAAALADAAGGDGGGNAAGAAAAAGFSGSSEYSGVAEAVANSTHSCPPPLWLLALLQVVAQHAAVFRQCSSADQSTAAGTDPATGLPFNAERLLRDAWPSSDQPFTTDSCSSQLLTLGLEAGRPAEQVVDFINIRVREAAIRTMVRVPSLFPGTPPKGPHLLKMALLHGSPQLLFLCLEPDNRGFLWGGRAASAVSDAVQDLAMNSRCSPITCPLRKADQQMHLQQMQQERAQIVPIGSSGSSGSSSSGGSSSGSSSSSSVGPMVAAAGPLPSFAHTAVQLALMLLQHPSIAPETLNNWLRYTVGASSTLPDLVRARAIVAAVLAAPKLPPGASAMHNEAVRQASNVGDPDLWSLVLLLCHRQRDAPDHDEGEEGVPLGDWDEDDEMLGDAGIAELVAGMEAANI